MNSPMFRTWYLKNYPDVCEAGVDPWKHYIDYGRREGAAGGGYSAARPCAHKQRACTHEARVDVCNALHTRLCERIVNQTRALLQSHSPCRHLRTTAA